MTPKALSFQKATNSGKIKKVEFRLNHPVNFDEDLRDECETHTNRNWADNLIKKLIVDGWGGWVDPAISFRQAYYALTADTDGSKPGLDQRYSYMTASARIEEAIPGGVLGLMKRSGYVSVYKWDGAKRDLYALIILVHTFMEAYAKERSDWEKEQDEYNSRYNADYDSDVCY